MSNEFFTSQVFVLKDKLFRYAKSIVNDTDLAKDVVQETFVKTWEKRKEMENVQNIEAWCMTVTRNFALMKHRHKGRQDSKLDSISNISEKSLSPLQSMEQNDVINKIDNIVQKLPIKLKEVFLLRDIENYSYNEICEITGYSISDVKVSVLRARKFIKEHLQKIYSYEKY